MYIFFVNRGIFNSCIVCFIIRITKYLETVKQIVWHTVAIGSGPCCLSGYQCCQRIHLRYRPSAVQCDLKVICYCSYFLFLLHRHIIRHRYPHYLLSHHKVYPCPQNENLYCFPHSLWSFQVWKKCK